MLIFPFLLDFLLEKIKFPTETNALIFPGRSGLRAVSSGVKLLEGFTVLAKTYWEMQGEKQLSPQPFLPPSCMQSVFKTCAATSPSFPFALRVTGIFPKEGILQIQMVTTPAPTEIIMKTRAHRSAPCDEMWLRHQHLPPLYYSKMNTLKR